MPDDTHETLAVEVFVSAERVRAAARYEAVRLNSIAGGDYAVAKELALLDQSVERNCALLVAPHLAEIEARLARVRQLAGVDPRPPVSEETAPVLAERLRRSHTPPVSPLLGPGDDGTDVHR
jgi:hypothetical protein